MDFQKDIFFVNTPQKENQSDGLVFLFGLTHPTLDRALPPAAAESGSQHSQSRWWGARMVIRPSAQTQLQIMPKILKIMLNRDIMYAE